MNSTPIFTAALCPNALGGNCSRCVNVCPTGAITLHGVPSIDASQCRNCGACASACPSGALHHPATDIVMRHISRLPASTPVSIRCQAVGDSPHDNFRLGACLSALGPEVLLALAVDRRSSISLIHGKCANCKHGDQGIAFRKALGCARTIISSSKNASKTSDIVLLEVRSPDNASNDERISRRGFFGLLRGKLDQTKEEHAKDQGTAHNNTEAGPSSKRERLSRSIRKIKASGLFPEGLQCAEIISRDVCLACGACARICPTGALNLEMGTSSCSLLFHPDRCIDCGQCITTCLRHNLSRKPARIESLTISSPITVFQAPILRCKRCAAQVTSLSEDGYCPICAKKYRM